MQLYGRAADGTTWSNVHTPGQGWSGWDSVGGRIVGNPVVTPYNTTQYGNQMEIYGRSSDGATWSTVYTPGSSDWSGWYSLGGALATDPTVLRYGTQLQLYGRAANGTMWSNIYTPGVGWTGWKGFGGSFPP